MRHEVLCLFVMVHSTNLCAGVLHVFPDQCGHVALKASQPGCEGEGREEEEDLQFCDLALGEEKVGGRAHSDFAVVG